MKILFTSDLHGQAFAKFAHALATKDYDIGIIAGDMLEMLYFIPHRSKEEDEIKAKAILSTTKKAVFIVLGNHDDLERQDCRNITNLHMRRVDRSRYNFVGYRYTLLEKTEAQSRKRQMQKQHGPTPHGKIS